MALLATIALLPSLTNAQPSPARVESKGEGARLAVDATPPKLSPEAEQMVSTMIVYNNAVDAMLNVSESQQYVRFHQIVELARPGDRPNQIVAHIFGVLPDTGEVRDEIPKGAAECDLGGGVLLVGAAATVVPGPSFDVRIAIMKRHDSYFDEVCGALARPERRSAAYLARLPHRRLFGVSLPIEIFIVRRESPSVSFEDQTVRLYWPNAFSESLPTDAISLILLRYGENFVLEMFEEGAELGELHFAVPSVGLLGPPNLERTFPDVEDARMKAVLSPMDIQWLTFLRGLTFPVASGAAAEGGLPRFMTRFATAEFGSRAFWEHFSDGDSVMRKANCLGARFLVEQNYARAEELTNYRECVALKRSGIDLP